MSDEQPMSMLDINLDDRQEFKLLPDSAEVQLRITRIDVVPVKSDTNRKQIAVVFEVTNDPLVDDIREWIALPTAEQKSADLKQYTRNVNRLAEFLECFGLSMPLPVEPDGRVPIALGREGWAIIRGAQNQDGSPQNRVRRFIARR